MHDKQFFPSVSPPVKSVPPAHTLRVFICGGSSVELSSLLSSGVESSCAAATAFMFKDKAEEVMTTTAEMRKMGSRKMAKQVNRGGFEPQ